MKFLLIVFVLMLGACHKAPNACDDTVWNRDNLGAIVELEPVPIKDGKLLLSTTPSADIQTNASTEVEYYLESVGPNEEEHWLVV